MKIKGKILSVILSLTMMTSVLPISSLVANAGVDMSGGDGSAGGGIGDSNWSYNFENAIVMRIGASAITDKTNENNMAEEVYRYGNQKVPEMHKYPLFMRAAVNGSDEFTAYSKVPTGTYYGTDDENLQSMTKAINAINNDNRNWRESHNEEYWNGKDVKYNATETIAGIKMSDKGCSATSVYLEDAIQRVIVLKNNGKISDADLNAFWYFYTRMASIAQWSRIGNEGSSGYTTGMGEGIRRFLIGDNGYRYPVLGDEKRKLCFQRGYIIALYAVYGDIAINAFTGSNFSNNSTRVWTNGFKSIVFDKCWTGLFEGNGCVSKNVLISGHTYAELSNVWNAAELGTINPYKEFAAKPTTNNKTSSIYFSKLGSECYGARTSPSKFWENLLPAYTHDQKDVSGQIVSLSGKQRGKNKFRGWCYVEIATDGGVPLKRQFNDYKNAQMSITYNGYLSPDGDSDYAKDSETFGDNGHVMTDLVYLSSPVAADDLDILEGFDAKVPSSIRLSTPFENTQFNLKKLQYRVVNAFGVTYDSNSKEIVYASGNGDVNTKKVNIPFNTLKNQWGKDSNTYKVRNKYKIEVAGFGDSYIDGTGTKQYEIYYSTGSELKRDTGKKVSSIKNCSWNTLKNDTNKFNTNCSYIKLVNNMIYPIIKENSIYYLVPVQFVSNLLVEVRADYTGKYTRDDVLKAADGTTKSVAIQEYLLSKNYNTGELTGQRLYSMLDNYATGLWGDAYNRSNTYSDNTRTGVNIGVDPHHDYYSYSVGTLFNTTAEFWSSQSYFSNHFTDSAIASNSQIQNDYRLYTTGKVSGSVAKLQFKDSVVKTAPLVADRNDTTSNLTILDSKLSTWVKSYGNTLIPNNSTVDKHELYYTEFYRDADGKIITDRSISSVNSKAHSFIYKEKFDTSTAIRAGCNGINNVSDIFKVEYDKTRNNVYQAAFDENKLSRFAAERSTSAVIEYSGMVDMTSNAKIHHNVLQSQRYNENNYVQATFPKLLACYMNYLYEKRGKVAANLTPNIAAWDTSSSEIVAFKNDYVMNSGVVNSINYIGHTTASKVIDNGFIRYAKTGDKIRIGDTNSKDYRYMLRMNSRGKPLTIAEYNTDTTVYDSSVDSPFGSSTFSSKSYNLIAPWTQSSYDIPIRYTILSHATKTISKQVKTQTYSKNNNTVSLSWQHGTNGTTSTTGTFLTVYPEVRMWAENDKTSNTSNPTATTTYTEVKTVGAKPRYVPAMTYTTATFNDLKADVNVIGTAVAYDTRAKKLAQTLGTADTQVLYSGTAINGTASVNAGGTVKTYVYDFRAGGAPNGHEIKTAWGNGSYNSKNVASAAMNKLLSNFEVSQSSSLAIYNGKNSADGFQKIDIGTSVSNGSLTSGTASLDPIVYNIYLCGGKVSMVIVKDRTGYTICSYNKLKNEFKWSNGTLSATKGAVASIDGLSDSEKDTIRSFIDSNSGVIKSRINDILNKMKAPEIANSVFEHDTGVTLPATLENSTGGTKSYNEDCSVLQIRSYTAPIVAATSKATFAEQIPINVGPQTSANKNDYFSNGYKGFVNTTAKITAKNTISGVYNAGAIITSAKSKHKKKGSTDSIIVNDYNTAKACIPDFIIGDVPISEALNG